MERVGIITATRGPDAMIRACPSQSKTQKHRLPATEADRGRGPGSLLAKLEEVRGTVDLACPVCGHDEWSIGEVAELHAFQPSGVSRVIYPLVPSVCRTCGNMLIFSAVALGLGLGLLRPKDAAERADGEGHAADSFQRLKHRLAHPLSDASYWAALFIGVGISGLLGVYALVAQEGQVLKPWVVSATWGVTIGSLAMGGLCMLFARDARKLRDNEIDYVCADVDDLLGGKGIAPEEVA